MACRIGSAGSARFAFLARYGYFVILFVEDKLRFAFADFYGPVIGFVRRIFRVFGRADPRRYTRIAVLTVLTVFDGDGIARLEGDRITHFFRAFHDGGYARNEILAFEGLD